MRSTLLVSALLLGGLLAGPFAAAQTPEDERAAWEAIEAYEEEQAALDEERRRDSLMSVEQELRR
jgi:hypothetical protein